MICVPRSSPYLVRRRERSSSASQLSPRSHAITLPHVIVSTGVHGSGVNLTPVNPRRVNSSGRLSRCVLMKALTPSAVPLESVAFFWPQQFEIGFRKRAASQWRG